MALIWADGFDDLASSNGANILSEIDRRYTATWTSSTSFLSQTGRLGGWGIKCSGTAYVTLNQIDVSGDTLIVGLAVCPTSQSTSWLTFLSLYDGDVLGINIRGMTRLGELIVYRGTTYLGTTSGAKFRYNTWCYVEMKVKCNSTTGTVEVRVGENTVLDLTGVNTQAGTHAYHNRLQLSLSNYYIDDFYVADASGSLNNEFLGNVRIGTLFPTGDEGTNNWTPSTGSDHYAVVDEAVVNDDTDYLSSSTTDQVDLFTYDDVSNTEAIFGVQVYTVCRNSQLAVGGLKIPIKSNSVTYDGSSYVVGNTDYGLCFRMAEIDPDTAALWTEAGVNAASFGIKVA